MLRVELEDYLLGMEYKEVKKGSFQKEYQKLKDDISEKNKLIIEYKFNKQYVYVIYHHYDKKVKRMKGKLSQLSLKNNTINGLKQI